MTVLSEELKAFLKQHENADVSELLLKHREILGYPSSFIADQLLARRKVKTKIPALYKNDDIVYPPSVNLEQSSSEETAKFKQKLVSGLIDTRDKGCDLTSGFGIDALFMSASFKSYEVIEPNAALIQLSQRNHVLMEIKNISYRNTSAESFIEQTDKIDFVYIDPSRRTKTNRKVFSLTECEPNVVALQNRIFQKSRYLLIKTSPLLDLQIALTELEHVKTVTVLSTSNECKELLFFCDSDFGGEVSIHAVNLAGDNEEHFSFTRTEEKSAEPEYAEAENYLYEPNASILKAGAFKSFALKMNMAKLHKSTHLYTTREFRRGFPGRVFKVIAHVKPERKVLEKFFPEGKANITTRNYPLTPDELRKKTQLKDGGEKFLIGFTDTKNKSLVVAERVLD